MGDTTAIYGDDAEITPRWKRHGAPVMVSVIELQRSGALSTLIAILLACAAMLQPNDRRCHRVPGASDGEATGGYTRMGPRRRGPGLRQGRGPILCGRPYLANTAGKCRTVLESRQRLHCLQADQTQRSYRDDLCSFLDKQVRILDVRRSSRA